MGEIFQLFSYRIFYSIQAFPWRITAAGLPAPMLCVFSFWLQNFLSYRKSWPHPILASQLVIYLSL